LAPTALVGLLMTNYLDLALLSRAKDGWPAISIGLAPSRQNLPSEKETRCRLEFWVASGIRRINYLETRQLRCRLDTKRVASGEPVG
jgi:hypothetical protein